MQQALNTITEKNANVMTEAERFLRKPEVQMVTALSDSTIRLLELEGKFPKRVLIGKRVVGWHRKQIMHWVATREVIDVH